MRFLALCPYLPDQPDHGGKIRSRMLLSALGRVGSLHIAAPLPSDDGPRRAESLARDFGAEVHALPAASVDSTGVATKVGAWMRGRSELLARRWTPASVSAVGQLLERVACDAIAVDSSHSIPLLPRADTPVLLHLHNIESALLARPDGVHRPWKERWTRAVEARLIGKLESRLARRARLSITTSALDRERLLELAPGASVEVVDNAVDLARLPLLPPPDAAVPMLLFVGSLGYPPNREAADELLRAHLPVLRAAQPEVTVRIVGRDDSGEVARLAASCGAEAVGFVEDLKPHYREATAVYLPIRSGGGTRIKVIEAFALGRPVVATRVAVEGLQVEAGEHYLEIDRPEDGVRALEVLRRDGADDMVRAARSLAEDRWSEEAAVARMARVIGEHFNP